MTRYLCIALSLIALSGCQLLPLQRTTPGTAKSEAAIGDADVPWLLAYYRDLADLAPDGIEREHQRNRSMLEDGCGENRLKLAMTHLRQDAAAPEDLLHACLDAPKPRHTALRNFAFLLHTRLRAAALARQNEQAARSEVRQLKDENRKLRRQVEALKAIERSLQDRNR